MKVFLTTTSFQDTPGPHHELLRDQGFDLLGERGPLLESRMLELVGDVDAFVCGDDEITAAVVELICAIYQSIRQDGAKVNL